jgi:hypothetical protein
MRLDTVTGALMRDLEGDVDIHSYLKTTTDALPALIMIGSVPSVQNFLQLPFIAKRIFPTAEDQIGLGKLCLSVSITNVRLKDRTTEGR